MATTVVAAVLLAGCGSESASVPNVVGYRLDDAHNILKDVGFEQFDDVDAIEDRNPFVDSNWVVLGQSPGAGESAEVDSTIRLEIAKPEDDGVRARIPVGSPVAEELSAIDARNAATDAKLAAEAEKRRQAEVAEAAKDLKEFVDKVDPSLRLMQNAVADLAAAADDIASSGVVTVADLASLRDINKALGVLWDEFENAPKVVNSDADETQEAIREFQHAADTLISAEGVAAASSLDRFHQLFGSAQPRYNAGLTGIYAGSGIQPPTV
ncbi:PASTA domain-containing protein [Rhodococcus sp. Q]|uniref:Stk1 family PASTA domain-containing Ser/Thr kinase n=1 Tax=Rhodococcus sp. Q TaxID=2502252 RepID=UPI00148597D8|nr:PASTA domain-containing protein [Rhodococcus sp. Q]